MTQQTQNKQLPNGWKEGKIKDFCILINGRAFKPTEWAHHGLPIIRIQNLNNLKSEFNYCDFEVDEKYYVSDGQLLFAWSGTPETSFGAHIWKGGKAVLNQHIFKVMIDEKDVNKKFLMYLFNKNVQEYVAKAHGTAGLAHITKGKFEDSIIKVPSLPTQSLIVSAIETKFTRLDAAVKSLKSIKAKLEIYRKAVLKKAFEKKDGWEEKRLKNLIEDITSGYACGQHSKSGNGVIHFRPYNITSDGEISFESIKIVDPNFSDKRLEYGDIVFNNTNSQIWVGKTCAYDREEKIGFSNHMTRIRVKKEKINFQYIARYLHYLFQRGFYYTIMKSHVNQSSVNIDRLQEININFPSSLSIQQQIVQGIESKFSVIDKVEQVIDASLLKAEKLRKAILKTAFEGKLVKMGEVRDEKS